jgi:hypothetical protein
MDELEIAEIVAIARKNGKSDAQIRAALAKEGVDWHNTDINFKNLGRSAVQGATFDFGDEILGELPEWLGGGEKAKAEMRGNDKAFQKKHPFVSAAANAAGGFAVPGLGAAKLIKGAKTIKGAIGIGAGLGAGAGALTDIGAGEGESLDDRVDSGTAISAGLGGLLGGAFPGVPGAGKAAISPSTRATGRLQGAINRSGGVAGLLEKLKGFKAAGKGADVTLADLSKPLRQSADFAANASEEAAEAIEKVALPRQANMANRMLDDVTSKVGNPDAGKIVSDLEQGTAAWADGPSGFGGMRAKNPAIVPAMANNFGKMLHSPVVKDLWKQAQKVNLIGPIPPANKVSFRVMQNVIDELGTAKEKAFRDGAKELAIRLKALHEGVIGEVENAVPGYKALRGEYHVRKELERAVKRGEELWDLEDTRSLATEIGSLAPENLQKVREGMASKLITKLRAASTNRDEAKRLVDRSAAMDDKLKIIFGDNATFKQFIQQAETEAEMAKLMTTLRGSATARRTIAQSADPAGMAATAVTSGPVAAAGAAVRSTMPRMIATKTAEKMGPQLMTKGSPAIEQLLKTWGMRPGLVPGWASKMAPVGLGTGAQNLFN